jgi:hypothetical protein
MERAPSSPGARSPYLAEVRSGFSQGERAAEGRGCFWRGTLNADRKANRKGASVRHLGLKAPKAAEVPRSVGYGLQRRIRLRQEARPARKAR